jgi:hypothetical protein
MRAEWTMYVNGINIDPSVPPFGFDTRDQWRKPPLCFPVITSIFCSYKMI